MKLRNIKRPHALGLGILAAALLSLAAPALAFHFFPDKEKTVILYQDGERKPIQTKSNTVKDFLKEQHIALGDNDSFWTPKSRLSNGSVVVIEKGIPVTILSNGEAKTIYTTQQTVQGALLQAGVDTSSLMPLENEMQKLHSGMQIHLIPYTVRTVSRTVSIPIQYDNYYDSSMAPDDQVVVKEGKAGKKVVNRMEYVSQGKIIKTEIVNGDVIDPGVPGIERTGSPDQAVGWMQTMEATAYHPLDGDGRGITATGTKAGYGQVAVDPSVIPLGSKVYIPDYGDAVATDTGRVILGNRIDLCMESYEECWNFGRKPMDVYIHY
jgi:uncharacterized protein YabE (DUF348 family)/3D (Asp-Asp-Asp) domain-containing protein